MTLKLFAGIDIGAKDAVVCCLDQDDNQLGHSRSLTYDLCGAQVSSVITTIEAPEVYTTSVYSVHLRDLLSAAGQTNPKLFAYEINPSLVAGLKKSSPKRPKTDRYDARPIAERTRFGQLKPFTLKKIPTQPLLQHTRYRLYLIALVTQEQTWACSIVFLKSSNYRKDTPFSNTFGKSSQALLRDFSPDEIASMDLDELISFISQHGNNRLKDVEQNSD